MGAAKFMVVGAANIARCPKLRLKEIRSLLLFPESLFDDHPPIGSNSPLHVLNHARVTAKIDGCGVFGEVKLLQVFPGDSVNSAIPSFPFTTTDIIGTANGGDEFDGVRMLGR